MRTIRLRYGVGALICGALLGISAQIQAQVNPPIKPAQPPPSLQMQPTPGTCPAGYIVDGKFVPKSQFQKATASPKKPAPPFPSKPSLPSTPSLPTFKSPLPLPPLPKITHVPWNFDDNVLEIHGELTSYGFDVMGSNLGNQPNEALLSLFTGSSNNGTFISGTNNNASFFRQVSNSRIAVNYTSGCQILPLQRNVQTQVEVIAKMQGTLRRSSRVPFTFPQTWAQYTPVISSVTKTADGIEIAGTNLGQPHEVCQIDVAATVPNGPAQVVRGSQSPNDFLAVSDTLLRVRMNPAPSGQRTVSVTAQPCRANHSPSILGHDE